jgi:hypothetical protein
MLYTHHFKIYATFLKIFKNSIQNINKGIFTPVQNSIPLLLISSIYNSVVQYSAAIHFDMWRPVVLFSYQYTKLISV